MPVGGEQLIAGVYTVTWNGVSVGIFRGDDGLPAVRARSLGQGVSNTDRYGRIKIDAVHLGYDYVFEGVLEEYPKAILTYQPFGLFGSGGIIGAMKYNYAKPLILTVIANGTTAVGQPNVLTALKAINSEDVDARVIYGPALREMPIKQDLYPSILNADGTVSSFTLA